MLLPQYPMENLERLQEIYLYLFFEKIQQRNLLIYRLDDYSQKNRHKPKPSSP